MKRRCSLKLHRLRLSKKPAGPRIINHRIKESLSGYETHCKITLYKKATEKVMTTPKRGGMTGGL